MQKNIYTENELLAVFDNAAIILILINNLGQVVRINKAGSNFAKTDKEQAIGKLAGEVIKCVTVYNDNNAVCGKMLHCKSCDVRNTFTDTFVNNNDYYKKEGIIEIVADNKKVPLNILVSSSKLTINNENFVLLTIDDITKLKQTEKELKDLIKTRDKLYSVIAHDLRNSFNAIMGFSNLLANKFDKLKREQIFTFSKHIQQAAHDSFNLLENLFEWTSSQWKHSAFNPERTNITALVYDITSMCKNMANVKDITINMHSSFMETAMVDPNMIKAVIRNLINNAVKFTNRGGEINVEIEKIDNNLFFSVTDNGIGMNPEKVNNLFSDNENETSPGTENEKGSGLGLLVCKEFVEKHGGKINAKSELGKGTKFFFYVPL